MAPRSSFLRARPVVSAKSRVVGVRSRRTKLAIDAKRIVLLGPPGVGKGTQAALLSKVLGIPVISTGNLLRKEVADGTELGKKAGYYMNKGDMAPDDLVEKIVLRQLKEKKKFILDGFPRNTRQAKKLGKTTPIDAVVELQAPYDELERRVGGRWLCSDKKCATIHNAELDEKAISKGACKKCGGELSQREDDKKIAERLVTYENETKPLTKFYQNIDRIHKLIPATGSPNKVFLRIIMALQKKQAR